MAEAALRAFPLANLLRLGDGRTVEWEANGDGEPLIWVEGGPGLAAHLARPDVALIGDRFRCHLVNAPGCGRTSPPLEPEGYDLEGHVAFFEEVRAALGLESVTVMGHSWGGLVAVAWASAHPKSVQRLVVIDGYAGVASVDEAETTAEREAAFDRVRDRPWFEAAVDGMDITVDDEAEMVAGFNPAWPLYFADPESGVAVAHTERLRRELRWNVHVARRWDPEPTIDLRPQLGAIRCPTLVVVGEHDFVCGPVWSRPLAAGILGARLEVIAGAGHLPQYEQPDEFRRLLFDWLDTRP